MRFLVAYLRLEDPGGTEVYALTLGEQLERLGHDVRLVTWRQGAAAAAARSRGLRVVRPEELDPGDADATVASDAATLLALAERVPAATRVLVGHSTEFAAQAPPQLAEACQAAVALNDRVAERLEAMAVPTRVVRLRQPVDLPRFQRLTLPARPPRRVALFGNAAGGARPGDHEDAVRAAGAEPVRVGRGGAVTTAPEELIGTTDAVVGIGRCALEGLAARRPVLVAGPAGADGWVRPGTFDAWEADGFSGRATPGELDGAALTAALRDPPGVEESQALYERIVREHDARRHAEDVVALVRELGAPPGPLLGPVTELARLVRLELSAHFRADLAEQSRRATELRVRALEERLAVSEELAAAARAEADAIRTTTRWRALSRVLAPLDRVRRR